MSEFSHIDATNQPAMVDISGKATNHRTAMAESIVQLDESIMALLDGGDIQSKKGPVFHTAIIAGIQAAKKTSDLIPLCHPLPIAKCSTTVEPIDDSRVIVRTEVVTDAKTGVEMEALSAASVAALTLYDMCKAITKGIVIENIRLVEKTGGKSDFQTNTR